jgi:membrane fusion protein (multidrug efflux system)
MADDIEQRHNEAQEEEVHGEAPPPARRGGRRITGAIVAVILIAVLVLGGIWLIRYQSVGKYMQSTNDAFVQADAVTVSPKVSGYVDRVFVAENQPVKAGQPLVQIDPRDYRAQASQFGAQIDVARANAQGVRAQIGEQAAAVTRARADLAAARSDAAFAHAEVARYTPLAASGAETRERLSQLRNQARQADSRVASSAAALLAAERRIGTLQSQVRQALAQGEASQAQLAAVNLNAGATLIRASIDGRVGDRSVRTGQYVQAGTRMMSIVPVQQVYVTANFKETQLGLMRVGQPVTVKVSALSDLEIPARIASFAPGTGAQFSLLPPQNATGNFTKIVQRVPVRIALELGPEARQMLIPGMSVDVTVDTRSAKGATERIKREQEARERKSR